MYNYQDTDNYFYDWWKHNTWDKPVGEPWGADAEPTYNLYSIDYESTDLENVFNINIEASAFTVDNEQRVAVFYDGYGEMLAVVYNILSVHTVPPRTNI